METVALYTLGCKVNQYETEAISCIFEEAGYKIVSFEEKADIYIINTCTVTNLSDRKSRQMIRRAKRNNEKAIVAAIGCYAQISPDEVSEIPEVDLVIGTKNKHKILDYINEFTLNKTNKFVDNIMNTYQFEKLNVDIYKERTRAFIKIQDGCNRFCSYCIIPYSRGPVRSRPLEDISKEVLSLTKKGFNEIVLTGIHIASYGTEIYNNISLIDIIKQIHEFISFI